jgi:hypothetical protein
MRLHMPLLAASLVAPLLLVACGNAPTPSQSDRTTQSPGSPVAEPIDLAGLRLGMTPTQVHQAFPDLACYPSQSTCSAPVTGGGVLSVMFAQSGLADIRLTGDTIPAFGQLLARWGQPTPEVPLFQGETVARWTGSDGGELLYLQTPDARVLWLAPLGSLHARRGRERAELRDVLSGPFGRQPQGLLSIAGIRPGQHRDQLPDPTACYQDLGTGHEVCRLQIPGLPDQVPPPVAARIHGQLVVQVAFDPPALTLRRWDQRAVIQVVTEIVRDQGISSSPAPSPSDPISQLTQEAVLAPTNDTLILRFDEGSGALVLEPKKVSITPFPGAQRTLP